MNALNSNVVERTAIDILKDHHFKPISDLNFCLDNGIEYYIGYNKRTAAICAIITDENNCFIDKAGLHEMADTAKYYGINHITLFTNYGIEIHSKHENMKCVGMDSLVKITSKW